MRNARPSRNAAARYSDGMTTARAKTVSLRLPADLVEAFDAAAAKHGRTRTEAIERAMRAVIDRADGPVRPERPLPKPPSGKPLRVVRAVAEPNLKGGKR